MAQHRRSNNNVAANKMSTPIPDFSGDERDSRSGEERYEMDLNVKPTYLLEHLATFTVNKDAGIVYPADGLRRLLQLEKTTGIWSQKMQLCLDYEWVLIIDHETGKIIERFPAILVQEPTAFTSSDVNELYNNILVFIVSGSSGSSSEMHIFQSQNVSAVHLVEDLKSLRDGKLVTHQHEAIASHEATTETSAKTIAKITSRKIQRKESPSTHLIQRYSEDRYSMGAAAESDSEHGGFNDETSSTSSDKYERDVTVLNHCFDDIEKFIARLQHAAAASRELERRRRSRKSKKKDPGEGLLALRTRPPHEKEFVDIFAKFKLSFNLLAKLKSHIHDPNAPELVHFLFTPLALIVEAASDTYFDAQIPSRVVNPLLTREAINLLINCVTSKETELWRSLGEAWTISRDQWKEDVGSYHPVFLDGWSPDYIVVDELERVPAASQAKHRMESSLIQSSTVAMDHMMRDDVSVKQQRDEFKIDGLEKYNIHFGGNNNSSEFQQLRDTVGDFNSRSEISFDSMERSKAKPSNKEQHSMQALNAAVENMNILNTNSYSKSTNAVSHHADYNKARGSHQLDNWLSELQSLGAKIVVVTYPRTANNDKELSVSRGEYLEVLDDTRKWWKARNIRGQIGHVPHTIVTPYNNYGDGDSSFGGHLSRADVKHSDSAENNAEQNLADVTDYIRSSRLGKKGEFRYF